jgi:hypothetical protein
MTVVGRRENTTLAPSDDALLKGMRQFHEFHTMMNVLAFLVSLVGAFGLEFVFLDNPEGRVK